jgi:hypothetical protein
MTMDKVDSDLFMAVVHLLESNRDIFVHDKKPGSQLVAFSFEPSEKVVPHVRSVIESVQPFASSFRDPFEVMLFTQDGMFDCRSDKGISTLDETEFVNPIF